MFKMHNSYHFSVSFVLLSAFTAIKFIFNFITKTSTTLVLHSSSYRIFNSSVYLLLFFKAITFHYLTQYTNFVSISINIFKANSLQ
jgi:hypothetical protein